jgi:hypothetical protein
MEGPTPDEIRDIPDGLGGVVHELRLPLGRSTFVMASSLVCLLNRPSAKQFACHGSHQIVATSYPRGSPRDTESRSGRGHLQDFGCGRHSEMKRCTPSVVRRGGFNESRP